MDQRNWIVIVPSNGEPIVNVGNRMHFVLLEEVAPELKTEANMWAAGVPIPENDERMLARGHINLLGRIRFEECPRNRNGIYDLVAQQIGRKTAKKKFKDSPFSDPINILELFIARGNNQHIPDEDDIADVKRFGMGLASVSASDMCDHLNRIMESENPAAAIRLAADTKCLRFMLPLVYDTQGFWQKYKKNSSELFQHLMLTFDYVCKHSDRLELRWAALLHDIGKLKAVWIDEDGRTRFHEGPNGEGANHEEVGPEMIKDMLINDLGMPMDLVNRICFFVRMHMFDHFDNKKGARNFVAEMGGVDNALDMLILRCGDVQGKPGQEKAEEEVEEMRELIQKVSTKGTEDWEKVDPDSELIAVLDEFDIL